MNDRLTTHICDGRRQLDEQTNRAVVNSTRVLNSTVIRYVFLSNQARLS